MGFAMASVARARLRTVEYFMLLRMCDEKNADW
jgi:hypothetical protein